MSFLINNIYDFGDILYLKTDDDQKQRIIVGIKPTPTGNIIYTVSCGSISSEHYDFELSVEKNILVTT
jgi:hypothetical protein